MHTFMDRASMEPLSQYCLESQAAKSSALFYSSGSVGGSMPAVRVFVASFDMARMRVSQRLAACGFGLQWSQSNHFQPYRVESTQSS